MRDPMIGKVLGDYTIEELLGQGGMARVYRGYDKKLDRYAAVKVTSLSDELMEEMQDDYKVRFLREARAIARLSHPNIVGVYQFDQVGEINFMAMHFIEGKDLRVLLLEYRERDEIMPDHLILSVIRDIAAALDYAHAHDVIHRDIKPSNIMVTPEGPAILTDFGLALSVPEGTVGKTFGSAHYIAPEQAISSAQAVPQSDLYSLGVVLYEMATGKVPFDDPSTMSVALKHLNEPPPLPTDVNPSISQAVEDVIMTALRKEQENRYANGAAMVAALEAAINQDEESDDEDTANLPKARPAPPPEPAAIPAAKPVDPAEETANTIVVKQEAKPAPAKSAKPDKAASPAPGAKAEKPRKRRGGLLILILLLLIIAAGVVAWQAGLLDDVLDSLLPTSTAITDVTPADDSDETPIAAAVVDTDD
jgi:serine/threonine protein kinase